MHPYIKPRWGAIALGSLCALGAAAILVEDVRHTGQITVDHLLAVLVLVATIGAGHMAVEEARGRHWLRAFVLAVLFLTGTTYCIRSTASRIAETRIAKGAVAVSQNAPRRETERELDTARLAVQDAKARADKACRADPNGELCRVWDRRQKAYQSQVAEIIRDMGTLDPERPADAGAKYAAQVLAAVTGTAIGTVETRLGLLDPLIPAVLLELGTVVFLGIGLSRPASRPLPRLPAPSRPALAAIPRAKEPKSEVEWVRDFVKSHGRRPTIAETQRAFPNLARSTAHRRIQAA